MRRAFRAIAAGLAAGLAFLAAACSEPPSAALKPAPTTPADLDARATGMLAQAFADPSSPEADIGALVKALPKSLAVSIGASRYDAASGATILDQVAISSIDSDETRLTIDQLRIWRLDAAFAADRLSGERLGEYHRLARRIEARGVRLSGLAKLLGPLLDSLKDEATTAAAESETDPDPEARARRAAELAEQLDISLTRADASIGRLVLDDVVLRPYELVPARLPPESTARLATPLLQTGAAWAGSLAVGTGAAETIAVDIETGAGSLGEAQRVRIGALAWRGLRGGDLDAATAAGFSVSGTSPGLVIGDDQGPPVSAAWRIRKASLQGLRLARAVAHLARAEAPQRNETDLFSLGVTRIEGAGLSLAEQSVLTLGAATFDLGGFHWLVPTHLRIDLDDAVIDIAAMRDAIDAVTPASQRLAEEQRARSEEILTRLRDHRLDRPSLDFTLAWDWNAASGVGRLAVSGGLDDSLHLDASIRARTPSFRVASAAYDAGAGNGGSLSQTLFEASRFLSAELALSESGGLDRLFETVKDLAPYAVADAQARADLAAASPRQMRGSSARQFDELASAAAERDAPLANAFRAMAGWIRDGGRLRLAAEPAQPLALEDILTGTETGLSARLGLVAEHRPAAPDTLQQPQR